MDGEMVLKVDHRGTEKSECRKALIFQLIGGLIKAEILPYTEKAPFGAVDGRADLEVLDIW